MPAPIIVPQVRVPDAAASAASSSARSNASKDTRDTYEAESAIPSEKKDVKAENDKAQASFMAFVNHLIATKPANGDKPLATQLSGTGMKQVSIPSDILENLYNEDGSVNEDGLNAFAAYITALSDQEMNPTFGAEGEVILQGQAGDDALADAAEQLAAKVAAAQAQDGSASDDVLNIFDKQVDLSAFNDDEKAKIAAALKAMSDGGDADFQMNLPQKAAEQAQQNAHRQQGAAQSEAHAKAHNPSAQGQATAAAQAGSVVPPEAMPAKWFDVSGSEKRIAAATDAAAQAGASDLDGADIQIQVHGQNASGNGKGGNAAQNGLTTAASVAQSHGAPGLGQQGSSDFAALLEQMAGESADAQAAQAAAASDAADDAQMAAAARAAAHMSPSAPSFAAGHVMPASVSGAAVAQQVAAAMGKASVKDGAQKLSVSLNPAELGKVMVDISMDDAQKVKVVLSAEKASSLHLLQKDSSALQQAMQDAGFDLSNMDLQFSFSGEGFGSGQSDEGRFAGMGRGKGASVPVQEIALGADDIVSPHGIYYDPSVGASRYHAVV